jgi:glucan phosphoethanolaminetransferase (alkaline phosphatase superfamily)
LALFGVTGLITVILSVPAALYLWLHPGVTNALSLLVSVGLFFALFTWLRGFVVQLVLGLGILILNLIETIHLLAFGGLVTTAGLEGVMYVDPVEVREFVLAHAGGFALGISLIALFAGLVLIKARLDVLGRRRRRIIAAMSVGVPFLLLIVSIGTRGTSADVYLPTSVVDQLAGFAGLNPLTHTVSGIVSTIGEHVTLERAWQAGADFRFGATHPDSGWGKEVYVLVIGESARRANWSLYGYPRLTNPLLSKRLDLVPFQHAVSPATVTSRSVPMSLLVALNDTGSRRTPRSIISAFREAGFKTFWLTNQGTTRTAVGGDLQLIVREADVVQTAGKDFWRSAPDEALLPALDRALADPAPRKFIVVHTLGSHTNYGERLPPSWARHRFKVPLSQAVSVPSGAELEKVAPILDDYDRTILYTDWILDQIIERCAKTGERAAVVYVSDHGERLYDDQGGHLGHGFGDFEAIDVRIPLLVWLSDTFVAQSPGRLATLRQNAGKPVSTGNLASSLLDLASVDFNGLDPSRSFFGPDFTLRPRQVITTSGARIEYDR